LQLIVENPARQIAPAPIKNPGAPGAGRDPARCQADQRPARTSVTRKSTTCKARHVPGASVAVGVEAPCHTQCRHALHPVRILQLGRLARLGATEKELYCSRNLALSTPCLATQSATSSWVFSGWRSTWIAVEHLAVQVDQAPSPPACSTGAARGQSLSRKSHRHAAQRHILGQALDPLFERGLEGVAVRAAVPEELDHLDLPAWRVTAGAGLSSDR
jgi:hypothetical protein